MAGTKKRKIKKVKRRITKKEHKIYVPLKEKNKKKLMETIENEIKKEEEEKVLTKEEIAEIISESGGIIAVIMKRLKLTYYQVVNMIRSSNYLRQAFNDAQEVVTDYAQAKHFELIKMGHWGAIKYELDNRGQSRGYSQDPEQRHRNHALMPNMKVLASKFKEADEDVQDKIISFLKESIKESNIIETKIINESQKGSKT